MDTDEKIGKLVLNVVDGEFADTRDIFNQIMSAKALDALDIMRIEVSKTLFGDDSNV